MTGWKIPTMNESMYFLLKMVDFPASHVKFSGGVKCLAWVCTGPGLIRKWPHQDIGRLDYSTKPSSRVETCHAQVLHECKRPKIYKKQMMEEILHYLGCLKPYQYWDIYVLHQLVQDFFHEQYASILDLFDGFNPMEEKRAVWQPEKSFQREITLMMTWVVPPAQQQSPPGLLYF